MDYVLTLATPTQYVSVPLTNVVRIVPLALLKEIPDAPEWFLGLLDLEGTSLPVMDLGMRLGLGDPPDYLLSTPVVIISQDDKLAGWIVQEVLGVGKVVHGTLMHTDLFASGGPPFLGVARLAQIGLTPVLDPARMMEICLVNQEYNTMVCPPQIHEKLQDL
ncbi:MAG: chemotaxis protein CheW [Magnetococcus sp. YQC-5]